MKRTGEGGMPSPSPPLPVFCCSLIFILLTPILMKYIAFTLLASLFFLGSCNPKEPDAIIHYDTATIVSTGYIGNGAQWDPYQLDYGNGPLEISEADWEKLYGRLDFMRPQFIRVMMNTGSYLENGKPAFEKRLGMLKNILDYCQSRGVTVLLGDWGGGMVDWRTQTVNRTHIRYTAELVDFLIREKGYPCIRYYNLINEPNGDWSATNTSYPLWKAAVRELYGNMQALGLERQVGIIGPDIAIWSEKEAWWIDSCAVQLGETISLYDIHTYPSKVTVNSNRYTDILRAYREKVPAGKKMVMGEIGFKFVEPADSFYHKENIRRAQAKRYASLEDSQMFVYDYLYGVDMADALFQTVNSGFSGSIAWMLDDAMHSKEAKDKLKIWGFWNIFGEEYFGKEEENVRPWYYAWSLLTRYMPAGSTVYRTTVSGDPSVKSMLTEKDNGYLLAIVNVSKEEKLVRLESRTLKELRGARRYLYAENSLRKEGDHGLRPNEQPVDLSLEKGTEVTLPAESLLVYSTFDY